MYILAQNRNYIYRQLQCCKQETNHFSMEGEISYLFEEVKRQKCMVSKTGLVSELKLSSLRKSVATLYLRGSISEETVGKSLDFSAGEIPPVPL